MESLRHGLPGAVVQGLFVEPFASGGASPLGGLTGHDDDQNVLDGQRLASGVVQDAGEGRRVA